MGNFSSNTRIFSTRKFQGQFYKVWAHSENTNLPIKKLYAMVKKHKDTIIYGPLFMVHKLIKSFLSFGRSSSFDLKKAVLFKPFTWRYYSGPSAFISQKPEYWTSWAFQFLSKISVHFYWEFFHPKIQAGFYPWDRSVYLQKTGQFLFFVPSTLTQDRPL